MNNFIKSISVIVEKNKARLRPFYHVVLSFLYVLYWPSFVFYLSKYLLLRSKGVRVVLVKMFSSKFGHLYMNTEGYLRDYYDPENIRHIFLITSRQVDTWEVVRIWRRLVVIHSYYVSRLFVIWGGRFGFEIETANTFPLNAGNFIDRRYFVNLIKRRNDDIDALYKSLSVRKHVTFTLRDSAYNAAHQNYDPQLWRDSHMASYGKALDYLCDSEGYSVVLCNRGVTSSLPIDSPRLYNYSKVGKYSLELEVSYILSASFHVASTTGLDTLSYYNGVPVLLINQGLGNCLQTVTMASTKIILLPRKIYSTREDRYLSLVEYLDLLRFCERNRRIDRFEPSQQKEFGVIPVHPSENEIYNAVLEMDEYVNARRDYTSFYDELQQRFWDIYPSEWVFSGAGSNIRAAHRSPHNVVVSPYFLMKNQGWLF